jgi:hypothetical protein
MKSDVAPLWRRHLAPLDSKLCLKGSLLFGNWIRRSELLAERVNCSTVSPSSFASRMSTRASTIGGRLRGIGVTILVVIRIVFQNDQATTVLVKNE